MAILVYMALPSVILTLVYLSYDGLDFWQPPCLPAYLATAMPTLISLPQENITHKTWNDNTKLATINIDASRTTLRMSMVCIGFSIEMMFRALILVWHAVRELKLSCHNEAALFGYTSR